MFSLGTIQILINHLSFNLICYSGCLLLPRQNKVRATCLYRGSIVTWLKWSRFWGMLHTCWLLFPWPFWTLPSFLLFQKTYASFFVISHNTVDDVAECLARKLLAYVVPFHELKSCRYIFISFLATCFMGKRVQSGVRPSKSDRFYVSFRYVTVFFFGKVAYLAACSELAGFVVCLCQPSLSSDGK